MCGIVGVVALDQPEASTWLAGAVRRMTGRLRHRGPDAEGVWIDEAGGVALGHRRLSVIDLSPTGNQPMHSTDGSRILVFNGEIYNHETLRHELTADGRRFRGHSDTEVLLTGIETWGLQETLKKANGMFALAVWNRASHSLTLARDRLGQKPLYYGYISGSFVFTSELKALTEHPHFLRRMDRESLALFLRHGYVPDPWCIWEGLWKLSPGTFLELRRSELCTQTTPIPKVYWSLRDVVEAGKSAHIGNASEAIDGLDRLLAAAVQDCMVSDVPVGAFLSGGIDSSTIVALMQARSSVPIPTFTVGFQESAFDEANHARAIANYLGTSHNEFYVTEAEALAVIPALPTLYDEPFADPSQIPTYLMAAMARSHATVCLSGDGGDELFGGYNRYLWGRRISGAMRFLPPFIRAGVAALVQDIGIQRWDSLGALLPAGVRPRQIGEKAFKLANAITAANPNLAYFELTSIWSPPSTVLLQDVEPGTSLSDPARWPDAASFVETMMLLDAETYLPGDILTKVDRATMGVGLEARIPLLDHRVVEFAWRLPLHLRIKHGMGKWLLRQVLYRYIPSSFIDRPKTGFTVPIGEWLRGDLYEWAAALLEPGRLLREGYLDPDVVASMWDRHLNGTENSQYQLWNLLMFQAWAEEWRPETI
jgi:asparagine synthase (glutamine-hydrolysing)